MTFADEFGEVSSIFLDTAPVIYYIEGHPHFGPLAKEAVDAFRSERVRAFSSVVTLTEVLSKPIEADDEKLAKKFAEFLKHGRNLTLVEISEEIAEAAGRLRGKYKDLRTIDAIQIAAAIDVKADTFLTNDKRLKKVKEIKVMVLKEYL